MSKPIFIVKLPNGLNTEEIITISSKLGNNMKDYHVLVIGCNVEIISFECYNTTDLDNKNFEELKKLTKERYETYS